LREGAQIGAVGGAAVSKPTQLTFETTWHSYSSAGPVGEGGSGRVYEVHNEDGEPCAIKCLDPSKATADRLIELRII